MMTASGIGVGRSGETGINWASQILRHTSYPTSESHSYLYVGSCLHNWILILRS